MCNNLTGVASFVELSKGILSDCKYLAQRELDAGLEFKRRKKFDDAKRHLIRSIRIDPFSVQAQRELLEIDSRLGLEQNSKARN